MTYSFFGTCANDFEHMGKCLKTIIDQTLIPNQIILIDSGTIYREEYYKKIIKTNTIEFIYKFEDSSRVEALNLAINEITSEYAIRYDSRTRFSANYAYNALKILREKSLKYVGGVPSVLPENNKRVSEYCAGIMRRGYIFLYPRHRRFNYDGYSSSIYLGCFDSNILKSILYRQKVSLISEDSLLSSDFRSRGYIPYISSFLKLSYVSRSSLIGILRLFNTYGYCRFNTLKSAKKIHSIFRYLFLCTLFCIFAVISYWNLTFAISLFISFLFIFNFTSEILIVYDNRSYIYPITATLCQISWISGFIWSFISIFRISRKKTNFIT